MVLTNTIYTNVSYTDSGGDLVHVTITGPLGPLPAKTGFTIELAGYAEDNADATRINLLGFTSRNGLQITVTPQLLPNAGPEFNNIYSAGYTNVAFLTAESDAAFPAILPTADIASIHTSSAVISSISLPDVRIGNVTLDPGRAAYIDRINTTNNQQATDSTFYNAVAGLVDVGGIEAAAIGSLVVNGSISAITGNPYDTSVTNDIRSIVSVRERIGSIVGLRTSLSGAVRADSIGSVRVANISGEITTRNALLSMSINLPAQFKGFINCAGHLHLGFPMSDGALITGQIRAGRGISGSVRRVSPNREDFTDTIYIPQNFTGSLANTGANSSIANVEVNGIASLSMFSAGGVGNISANEFGAEFVVAATGGVGNVEASSGSFNGHITAGASIGNVKAVRSMLGTLIAGGNVGRVECVEGTLQSLSVQAGGDVAGVYAYRGMLSTSIVAKGNLGDVDVPVAGLASCYLRGANIGNIRVHDGSLHNVSIISDGAVGDVSAFGTVQGFGVSDTSVVARSGVGNITGNSHTGSGIRALKVECKFGSVGNVTGTSAGEFGKLAGDGIEDCNIVCLRGMGSVTGTSAGGRGVRDSKFISTGGGIAGIAASGWLDGMSGTTAVVFGDVNVVIGESKHSGSGIVDSSITSTNGSIGIVSATGGAAEGSGMSSVRIQATGETSGNVGQVSATCGANGQHALSDVTVHGTRIEGISVLAKSGPEGNGVTDCNIRAFGGALGGISVVVNSTSGKGMVNTKVQASDDIGSLRVQAYNNHAIEACEFVSRGDYGDIRVETQKSGHCIVDTTFIASGRIQFLPTDDEMPKGQFGNITVVAGGTAPDFGGVVRTQFSAIQGYGVIDVKSKGGPCILESTFTADADFDGTGAIAGIRVTNAGRQRQSSSGIVGSTFTATAIGVTSGIVVDIQTVEGGDGIAANSSFLATTAPYDGRGNFNNTGLVGTITVSNASGSGDGISNSIVVAGAAGGIGDISVTVSGGRAIVESSIAAIAVDPDQSVFGGSVGNVTVRAGRAQGATIVPAGIVNTFIASGGGIGNVLVDSVGNGIVNSVFVGDFFVNQPLAAGLAGNIGDIVVNVPGRFGSCITSCIFNGSSLGNVVARLVDDAARGVNAIASCTFLARAGAIASVTATHSYSSPPYPAGTGFAVLNSLFAALTAIGPIVIQGRTLNAAFVTLAANALVLRSTQTRTSNNRAASASPAPIAAVGEVGLAAQAPAPRQAGLSAFFHNAAASVRLNSDLLAAQITAGALNNSSRASLTPGSQVSNLGPVVMNVTDTSELKLQSSQGAVGPIIVNVLSASSDEGIDTPINVTLDVQAQVVQSVSVRAAVPGQFILNAAGTPTIKSVDNEGHRYTLSIRAPDALAVGNVTSANDVSLSAASVTALGDVTVENSRVLDIDDGFPRLTQLGALTCGALRSGGASNNVVIGTPNATSTTCGRVVVSQSALSAITFAFAKYSSSPNTIIAGVPTDASAGKGTVRNHIRLVVPPFNPCVFSAALNACDAPRPKPRPEACREKKRCEKRKRCKRA